MLTCFKLQPEHSTDEFCRALATLTAQLKQMQLLHSTGPVGRRQRDTIMDTDDERDHEFFFIMSFRDRAQCDLAVEQMYRGQEPLETIHKTTYANIVDQVFICWEDLPSDVAS